MKLALLTLLLISYQVQAVQCPDKESAPYCPDSGSTLLDDTYPVQSFVISNKAYEKSYYEAEIVPVTFVRKIIENYDYKNVPQIVISTESATEVESIKKEIRKNLTDQNLSSEEVEKILTQITQAPIKKYTWQQDWFESFVDLKTGAPTIRQIQSYEEVAENSDAIFTKAVDQCSITKGDKLASDYKPGVPGSSFDGGEYGGNIEGAPGGFCLTGDNQGKKFSKQFCGDEENIIQLKTSWLTVGHVDEIFKIMPTNYNDGRPKECEFSLLAASPKKGIELLGDPKGLQSPFIKARAEIFGKNDLRYSRVENVQLCTYVRDLFVNKARNNSLTPAARSVFLRILFGSLVNADTRLINMSSEAELEKIRVACIDNIENATNLDIKNTMQEDNNFVILNDAIEESIKKDKELIKSKILSRLPQCKKYYDEIDVPNLFYGDIPITNPVTGKHELASPGGASSYLPNPTNAVVMNKTLLFSDTGNSVFNSYLKDQLAKRKMKADFIESWEYAHMGGGNIHCSSHSIPHCKPRK